MIGKLSQLTELNLYHCKGLILRVEGSDGKKKVWIKEIQVVMASDSKSEGETGFSQDLLVGGGIRSTACKIPLSPGESIAVWLAVISIFGNLYLLDHLAFRDISSTSPTSPHFKKAVVKYI